jgi:hypothetical protein
MLRRQIDPILKRVMKIFRISKIFRFRYDINKRLQIQRPIIQKAVIPSIQTFTKNHLVKQSL